MNENPRDVIIARCRQIDFAALSPAQYLEWIDTLPRDEFIALIALHDEFNRSGKIRPPKRRVSPPSLIPDNWVPYAGEGDMPLPADQQCWVLFPDGDTAGPNRADAFLWGGDGQATIVAYQPAP